MTILTKRASEQLLLRSGGHIAMRVLYKEVDGITKYTHDELQQVVDAWHTNTGNNHETFALLGDSVFRPDRVAEAVRLSEVATVVTNMYVDDEGIVVVQGFTDTPHGRLLKTLLEEEAPMSLNAVVTLKDNGDGTRHITLHYLRFGSEASKSV